MPLMSLSYRKVQFKDLLIINLLENRYFDGFDPLYSLITAFISESSSSFLCKDEERIVGVVLTEMQPERALITTLCVEKGYSNRGIGRTLMDMSIQSIEDLYGNIIIELMVKKDNGTARKLYESLGFKIERQVEGAYFDGSDGFIMTRNQ